jgi:hypothetical protein
MFQDSQGSHLERGEKPFLHQVKEYAHKQKVTLQRGKIVMSHGSSKGIQVNLVTP